jgi:DNA-binding CsgD family transcriptional regulator
MNAGFREKIHAVWDELSDFEGGNAEDAAARLMALLCNFSSAANATWAGAIRVDAKSGDDPLKGWRVGALQALQRNPASNAAAEAPFEKILEFWEKREIDPSFLLPMRDVGAFRTHSFRRELPPEWFETPFYRRHYGANGIFDAVFIAFPLNEDCESHFGFYSERAFTDEEIALLAYALRGIKWFHRRLVLGHGLLMASSPLTPTERMVLRLLLTDLAEKQIAPQLGMAFSTAHQHIVSIYRKFGVGSRAGLMSLWLSRRV